MVVKEHTDALAVVNPSDGLVGVSHVLMQWIRHKMESEKAHLGEHIAHFQDLQFRTPFQVFRLVYAVGYHDFVQSARIDPINGLAAQDAVGN